VSLQSPERAEAGICVTSLPEVVDSSVSRWPTTGATYSGPYFAYVVGSGNVHQVALFRNEGETFDHVPTLAEIAERWDGINDFSNPKPGR
jgi:hypothetical protein